MSSKLTSELPCPSAHAVRTALQHGPLSPLALLLDLLEVADAAGAPQLSVVLDMRQHGSQSLLHAGLAGYQGGC